MQAILAGILDEFGKPIAPVNGHTHDRKHLVEFLTRIPTRRELRASYDAARDSDDFRNYWLNSDQLDANSANSFEVRRTLRSRSRYEVGSNGYVDGMVQTDSNYLMGTGPGLRMETGNAGFNQAVEAVWKEWTKAIKLRRKLWCMAHAKTQDGEAFALLSDNPRVKHRILLDLRLIEAEQCTTPFLPIDPNYIDGVRIDEFENVLWYDILPEHPGSNLGQLSFEPERVPAEFVVHWLKLRRPGQQRGVPEFTSTLPVGASSRRFREATIAAAETAADLNVLLKTQMSPNVDPDEVAPLSTQEIQKRMMTTLPMGWDGMHMKSEHPNATYESFFRQQLNEMARPKSMPYNVAACDSSSYNYASGRLDHQTYFGTLNIDRLDCEELVLDKIFSQFWSEATIVYGWRDRGADPDRPPLHGWDWPKHPVADLKSEAAASDTNLKNGSLSLSRHYSERGLDFEDELQAMARDYGLSVDEMRARLLDVNLPAKSVPVPAGVPAPSDDEEEQNSET